MNVKAEDTEVGVAGSARKPLREQGEIVGQDLKELGRLARDAAQEKIEGTRRAATDLYDQGRQKAGDLETQLLDYVREKPLKSVLIAAGVGLLFGAFLGRR